MIEGTEPQYLERVQHAGALPELRQMNINLYRTDLVDGPMVEDMAAMIKVAYLAL
jgi:hypothetical protein